MFLLLFTALSLSQAASLRGSVDLFRGISKPDLPEFNRTHLGVYGGRTVSQAEYDSTFPFVAQPVTNWQVWCTASVIAPRWVLFAAHCINGDIRTITVGSPIAMQGTQYGVVHQTAHPEYKGEANGYYADVALIQVDRDITVGAFAQVLGVNYQGNVPYSYQEVTVVGYGGTYTGSPPPYALQTATITHTQSGCTPGDICVQGRGTGVCPGDSGGPLLYQGIVIGVASRANCEGGFGIYAETERWGAWIADTAGLSGGGNSGGGTGGNTCDPESWCDPNSFQYCQIWANAGECNRNPAFMHACCKKECGLC